MLTELAWAPWYLGWKPGPARAEPGRPVFVSVTDFHTHSVRDAPGAWRTGIGLRRSWPRIDGAIGLWLWAQPSKLRSGSVSVWRSENDLMRFVRSPGHRSIVRAYRPRMSGISSGWTAAEFDRRAIWRHALRELTRAETP